MKRVLRWLFETDGATSVEYAVMLTLIIAVCIGALRLFGDAAGGSFAHSATEIEAYFPVGS
jgi:Flp pilus assembly pilin Flp